MARHDAWAIEWLGIESGSAVAASSKMQRQAVEPETIADDKDSARAAKVAAIVGECIDLSGTPAERYLRARGIIVAPPPACLRYRSRAHGRYGALVALATDANGSVNAVQQMYVTEDGRKAPVKVQKRTNKARDDWSDTSAVRLPGAPPIILSEGVENALSIWQGPARRPGPASASPTSPARRCRKGRR